jgi:uncharacterized membrane protein YcaP (DUF421 family)
MTMHDVFSFTVSPLELVVRGSLIYLGLVLVLRFVLRRDVGSMSVADVLFIVLLADAAQNAMAGEYTSLADGAVLLGTLVGWNLILDWLNYHSPLFRRFIEPPPLPLVRDGKWLRQNLKKEWITTEEVQSKLREQGIDDIAGIRVAFLEPSGELGVIRDDGKKSANAPRDGPAK